MYLVGIIVVVVIVLVVVVVIHRTGEGGLVWPVIADSCSESQTGVMRRLFSCWRSCRIQVENDGFHGTGWKGSEKITIISRPHAGCWRSGVSYSVCCVFECRWGRRTEYRPTCWHRRGRRSTCVWCSNHVQVSVIYSTLLNTMLCLRKNVQTLKRYSSKL